MKKSISAILSLLLILSIAFSLAGCKSREQRLSDETAYEETHMKKMKMKIVECINNN